MGHFRSNPNLESPVEFFATRLEQFNITGGVDRVPQLGILPLAQVVLFHTAVQLELLQAVLQSLMRAGGAASYQGWQ